MARGVDALGAFGRWRWPPAVSLAARAVCHHRHRFLCGSILIGVHHDGHNRRERGSRPLTAPFGAVAGGALGGTCSPSSASLAIMVVGVIFLPRAFPLFQGIASLAP